MDQKLKDWHYGNYLIICISSHTDSWCLVHFSINISRDRPHILFWV